MEPHNKSLVEQFNNEFKDMLLPVTVFIGIETVVGFFGNLLVFYVFFYRYHICNFKYFVLCLAISDFASTLTIMPGEILTQLQWYVYPGGEICKIKSFFNNFTFSSQTLCLLAIAVDRYRKVCVPFGWQIQPRAAFVLCFLINVIAVILAFPVAFFWGLRRFQIEYKNTNITVTVCEKDERYAATKRPLEYVMSLLVFYVMSFIAMLILYIIVARKLFGIQRGISAVKNFILTHSSSVKKTTPEAPTCSTADVVQSDSYQPSNDSDYSSEQPKLQKVSTSNAVTKLSMKEIEEIHRLSINKTPKPSEQTLPPMPKCKPRENEDLSEDKICESEVVSSDQGHTLAEDKQTTNDMCISTIEVTNNRRSQMTGMQHEVEPKRNRTKSNNSLKRKTIAMLILTSIFILTAICYRTMISLVANGSVLQNLSNSERTAYFFFLRLYFINHVINPIVYYALDLRFRKVTKGMFQAVFKRSVKLQSDVSSSTP